VVADVQLIDAGMIAFAAWHALKGRVEWPLTFQVPRMLRKAINDVEGPYALFWNAERLWKCERWPAYRDRPEIWDHAGRDDFESMLAVLSGLGAVQYRSDGREADELLAAVCHAFEGTEPIVIRSDDKDFMQLLSGSTRMQGRVRGTVRFSDVKPILGVTPAYVVDFLALSGDDADGIPRIVTPSMARKLIASRGHVRDWIDRDLRVDERVRQKLADNRDQLALNLELVDLSESAVGAPPSPLLEGWGDLDAVRDAGDGAGIGYLTSDDLGDEFRILRRWGEETRARLEDVLH
jgi:5'-3' exonuclease